MLVQFYKYHGTGNDFIIIDNRMTMCQLTGNSVSYLCDRRFGIGADGLILLEASDLNDFRMVYFNSDGQESTMCGNGGRCITAFANMLGLISQRAVFEAVDGIHESMIIKNTGRITEVKVKMNEVRIDEIPADGDLILDTGSPHIVRMAEHLDRINVKAEGSSIRFSPRYREQGINVNFVEPVGSGIHMRTYERGVEDETLSCGTGTVAVAIYLALKTGYSGEIYHIRAPGGTLVVHLKKTKNLFHDIWLEGPATFVFKGELNIEEDIL
jgi:diaminopimelate epimerase